MIGGMVGNNSCGSNSVVYKSTREHVISLKMILSDGNEVEFKDLSQKEFDDKVSGKSCSSTIEQNVYKTIDDILSNPENQKEIIKKFPQPSVTRRNTGYAIDLLMQSEPFNGSKEKFNMCKLIAGSEGTLGIITEIKLDLDPLPPKHNALVCIHFHSLYESLEANLIALKYQPYASELIDHYILECTKENIAQRKNRFFIKGDPEALLIVEIAKDNPDDLERTVNQMVQEMKTNKFGYHYPVLKGEDVGKIWTLRKAGLGLLSNIPGDAKPVPVVEDTAVDVNDLPAYIREFNETLKKYGLYCVHYAHASAGELHLRPIIDLKTSEGQQLFKTVLDEVAQLVKKYRGSLSGEHGDGRLRGEFIPFMIGERNYALLEKIKFTWDPDNIFNPGKIVRTPSMNTFLRYQPDHKTREIKTYFDFTKTQGILRAAEMCNGSGDCRKTVLSGGTMCPSYMVTKDEKDTTRARANILRELLTNSRKKNPFDHQEIKDVLDLCLSCKGCKSECPSNVDMARLKGEFLQNYYDANGIPLRSWLIGNINKISAIGIHFASLYNFFIGNSFFSSIFKKVAGFAKQRAFPKLYKHSLRSWIRKHPENLIPQTEKSAGIVYLFIDEFTNYTDVELGKSAILLLSNIGYEVRVISHPESGRAFISKGMIKKAKKYANKNVRLFSPLINDGQPLVGIEPSAILSFRDEYPDLVSESLKAEAKGLVKNTHTIEEFLSKAFEEGKIQSRDFTRETADVHIHVHCHQKSLSSETCTEKILAIPENYNTNKIPSGCCGMAGSFGFEKEHYDLSMNVGELVLFPTIRKTSADAIIAAAGTSCRHQILDGTDREAMHPVEILWRAHKKYE
jgi:Fe-S oxidoreductase/FAD/FMN-containing dehydrogenase